MARWREPGSKIAKHYGVVTNSTRQVSRFALLAPNFLSQCRWRASPNDYLMKERSFNPISPEDAMKYLCLIYDEEARRGTMPKEQMDAMMEEYGAFTEGIRKNGKYVAGEALQPTQTA